MVPASVPAEPLVRDRRERLERALQDALGADVDPRAGGHLAVHGQPEVLQPAELLPVGPVADQVGVGDQHPRRPLVGAHHADRLARLHQHRLVVAQRGQRAHQRVVRLPAARRLAGAAVDHEVLGALGVLRVEVVHQHPQRRLGLPRPGGQLGAAGGADRAAAGSCAGHGPSNSRPAALRQHPRPTQVSSAETRQNAPNGSWPDAAGAPLPWRTPLVGGAVTDVLLSESDQTDLRYLFACEPVPGRPLPGRDVLERLARLVPCDAVGVVLAGPTGTSSTRSSCPAATALPSAGRGAPAARPSGSGTGRGSRAPWWSSARTGSPTRSGSACATVGTAWSGSGWTAGPAASPVGTSRCCACSPPSSSDWSGTRDPPAPGGPDRAGAAHPAPRGRRVLQPRDRGADERGHLHGPQAPRARLPQARRHQPAGGRVALRDGGRPAATPDGPAARRSSPEREWPPPPRGGCHGGNPSPEAPMSLRSPAPEACSARPCSPSPLLASAHDRGCGLRRGRARLRERPGRPRLGAHRVPHRVHRRRHPDPRRRTRARLHLAGDVPSRSRGPSSAARAPRRRRGDRRAPTCCSPTTPRADQARRRRGDEPGSPSRTAPSEPGRPRR